MKEYTIILILFAIIIAIGLLAYSIITNSKLHNFVNDAFNTHKKANYQSTANIPEYTNNEQDYKLDELLNTMHTLIFWVKIISFYLTIIFIIIVFSFTKYIKNMHTLNQLINDILK